MKVTKRDGRVVEFDSKFIGNAIRKAMEETEKGVNDEDLVLIEGIVSDIEKLDRDMSVEEIQDIVENKLMCSRRKDVAKEYIRYRHSRKKIREMNYYKQLAEKTIEVISNINDNSNVDENSFGGREQRLLETIMKELGLSKLPPHIAELHRKNILYNHDLSKFALGMTNCLNLDVEKLLKNGFKTRQGDVKGVKHYYSFCQVICVLIQLQSLEQYGGCGICNFDHISQDFVRYSFADAIKEVQYDMNEGILDRSSLSIEEGEKTLKKEIFDKAYKKLVNEIKQGNQAMITNLVTLQSRSGGQLPFSSINLGLNTSKEGRLVVRLFFEELQKGIGRKNRSAIFPISCYQVKKGINWFPHEPNYDLRLLALKTCHKRLYPTFVNCEWSQNKATYLEEEMNIMGCVDGKELVTYKYKEELFVESFKRMWNRFTNIFETKEQEVKDNYYIDLQEVKIYDTLKGFVNVYRIIKNKDKGDWIRVKFSNGRCLLATADHPLYTINKGRTFVEDLKIEDEIICNTKKQNLEKKYTRAKVVSIEQLGYLNNYSYDVTTESDYFEVSGIYSYNCRTIIGHNIQDNSYRKTARGNLAPVSISLPYLGLRYRNDLEGFFKELNQLLEYAKESLLIRYNIMKSQKPSCAKFMYENFTIMGAEECTDTVENALKNQTLAIGYIGLAECLKAITNYYHNENEETQKLGIKIVKTIRDYCDKTKQETMLNFATYATPAEMLSRKALISLREEFGIIEGVTDKEFISNSHHVPIHLGENVFKKIEVESVYSKMANGGNIFHIEVDGRNYNEKAMDTMLQNALENDISYIRFSHPISTCLDCSYNLSALMETCEKCGSDKVENLAIVTGYLSSDIKHMNKGKQDEVKKRKINNI